MITATLIAWGVMFLAFFMRWLMKKTMSFDERWFYNYEAVTPKRVELFNILIVVSGIVGTVGTAGIVIDLVSWG